MGKIRVKTIGIEQFEEEEKRSAKIKKEQKQARVAAEVPVYESKEETIEPVIAIPSLSREKQSKTDEIATSQAPRNDKKKAKKEKFAKKKSRSKKYQTVATLVDRAKLYPLSEALELLPKVGMAKFDETVELHINTIEPGIASEVTLPHGTGKQVNIAIADDKLISEIEKGKIDFDVLLAQPSQMAKLAKVARILGPKGLMPNPKNGTIAQNPQEAAKKYAGGLTRLKTETKIPVMHTAVGKVSFGEKKLGENINALISSLPKGAIKNITLKSTMSPGIKLSI